MQFFITTNAMPNSTNPLATGNSVVDGWMLAPMDRLNDRLERRIESRQQSIDGRPAQQHCLNGLHWNAAETASSTTPSPTVAWNEWQPGCSAISDKSTGNPAESLSHPRTFSASNPAIKQVAQQQRQPRLQLAGQTIDAFGVTSRPNYLNGFPVFSTSI